MSATPRLWLPNPEAGTNVALGFVGSESGNWTAIRAETREGFQFTPRYGPDDRPTIWNPEQWDGRIPRGEVAVAVAQIFETWQVKRFYCDPDLWYSEIGEWALAHGDKTVLEWPTNSVARMFPAIRRMETDLTTKRITHDGCPITEIHFKNCRKIAKAREQYILGQASNHQKIDAAKASIIAHEAAADAREAGWAEPADKRMFCF